MKVKTAVAFHRRKDKKKRKRKGKAPAFFQRRPDDQQPEPRGDAPRVGDLAGGDGDVHRQDGRLGEALGERTIREGGVEGGGEARGLVGGVRAQTPRPVGLQHLLPSDRQRHELRVLRPGRLPRAQARH
jgi:hypothetical protein